MTPLVIRLDPVVLKSHHHMINGGLVDSPANFLPVSHSTSIANKASASLPACSPRVRAPPQFPDTWCSNHGTQCGLHEICKHPSSCPLLRTVRRTVDTVSAQRSRREVRAGRGPRGSAAAEAEVPRSVAEPSGGAKCGCGREGQVCEDVLGGGRIEA